MASNYSYSSTDLDDIFKGISGYQTGDVPPAATTSFKVEGVDLTGRYAPANGLGSSLNDLIAYNVGYKVDGTDIRQSFRDINCPDVQLYGPSSVEASSFPAGVGWTFTAHTDNSTITGIRFMVDGHGLGAWTAISQTDYAGFAQWEDPFANPSISYSAGTYTFIFQAMDANHLVGSIYMFVTVT